MCVIDVEIGNASSGAKITATIGLVVHAAVDGVALGAAATTTHTDVEMIVFIAIMLHKVIFFVFLVFMKSIISDYLILKQVQSFKLTVLNTFSFITLLLLLSHAYLIPCSLLFCHFMRNE